MLMTQQQSLLRIFSAVRILRKEIAIDVLHVNAIVMNEYLHNEDGSDKNLSTADPGMVSCPLTGLLLTPALSASDNRRNKLCGLSDQGEENELPVLVCVLSLRQES